jgi:hypothetical protein
VGRFYCFLTLIAMTDSSMLKTTLWVSFFAICICWAIGAYNRLVRLRSAANEARAIWQTTENTVQSATAIAQYNQAIKQFPASLLAALFAFKPLMQSDDKTT